VAWLVLRAFSCAHIDDGSRRWSWPFAARVRAASCPFPSELPAGARHPSAGRAFPEVETFCEALCCDQKLVAAAVSLPPTPLVRGRTPSTPTTHHPRICPPHATTRAHLVAQPDELEVVAPLVVAQPELDLIGQTAGLCAILLLECAQISGGPRGTAIFAPPKFRLPLAVPHEVVVVWFETKRS
jgi:hypothetical protein